MNDNVTYLKPAEFAQLEPVLAAERAFTTAWQQGAMKFAPLIHEGLERHMKLFDGCRQQLARNAQRLVAEIAGDPLADILDALGAGEDEEIFGLAEETRDTVVSLLGRLSSHLASEHQALEALPMPNGDTDRQQQLKRQKNTAATERQLGEEHAREAAKAENVLKAIATLEANGLQTRFGGVVPSLAELQKLAAPGGKEQLAAEAMSKAIDELKVLLGDLIEGMRYAQLQNERRAVQERVKNLARQLHELARLQAELLRNLAALDGLPNLLELRQQWGVAIGALRHSLQAQHVRIVGQSVATASDVSALAQMFATLLGFLRNLLEQHRRAF